MTSGTETIHVEEPTIITSHRAGVVPLSHEMREMSMRYKRRGELCPPWRTYGRAVYQNAIDWLESIYNHDELPPVYDAIVAARNAA